MFVVVVVVCGGKKLACGVAVIGEEDELEPLLDGEPSVFMAVADVLDKGIRWCCGKTDGFSDICDMRYVID